MSEDEEDFMKFLSKMQGNGVVVRHVSGPDDAMGFLDALMGSLVHERVSVPEPDATLLKKVSASIERANAAPNGARKINRVADVRSKRSPFPFFMQPPAPEPVTFGLLDLSEDEIAEARAAGMLPRIED